MFSKRFLHRRRRIIFRFVRRWGIYVVVTYFVLGLLILIRLFSGYGDIPPPSLRARSNPPPTNGNSNDDGHAPELDPPPPALYGTSSERCFILGRNDADGHAWHMNSRGLCSVNGPICLNGPHLEHITTFSPRGSGTCEIVSVGNKSAPLVRADTNGLNESCASYRRRHVINIYGDEKFREWNEFIRDLSTRRYSRRGHHAASWHSDFAIIVPKYPWSWNICHYNRIWNFVLHVVRNLDLYAPPSAKPVQTVDVLFRSGFTYSGNWPRGLREATLPSLEAETGIKVRVGKLRFDYRRDFQCVKKGILLGDEGRVDAFPYLNDTDIWPMQAAKEDNHWPLIPEESLWVRHAVYTKFELGDDATFDGPGVTNFRSIPVPPKRLVFLERNPRSPRRLTMSGNAWFRRTLVELTEEYGFELKNVRFNKEMTLAEQVQEMRNVGIAVGLHGANMVNTMFMPAGAAMFEIFPWRYVRFYYAGGLNSGLRYSFHEPESGVDKHCNFDKYCFMRYRETVIYLTHNDRVIVRNRLENAIKYINELHESHPQGTIMLKKHGTVYEIPRSPLY